MEKEIKVTINNTENINKYDIEKEKDIIRDLCTISCDEYYGYKF